VESNGEGYIHHTDAKLVLYVLFLKRGLSAVNGVSRCVN